MFPKRVTLKINIILMISLLLLILWYLFSLSTGSSYFMNRWRSLNMDDEEDSNSLRYILNCNNRDFYPEIIQHGNFWILKNYIRAEHGHLNCYETITYTTHSDFTFLDNVAPLVERVGDINSGSSSHGYSGIGDRYLTKLISSMLNPLNGKKCCYTLSIRWRAPISIAMYTPGNDFELTIRSIYHIRRCLKESSLVRKYVTFHLFFESKHFPRVPLQYDEETFLNSTGCSMKSPYHVINSIDTFRTKNNLIYPVNVARNIARNAALTHFVLASDIELYPSPGLANDFLTMIQRNRLNYTINSFRVYPIAIFEVTKETPLPNTKSELVKLLRAKKAITFHESMCAYCHTIPKYGQWLKINETEEFNVFHVANRERSFGNWEPIYIGTNRDPFYEERLSWEGMRDKMTQGYVMCVQQYEFHILNNAFLVHKPGIKKYTQSPERSTQIYKTNKYIAEVIYPELKAFYGVKDGCRV